MSPLLQQGRAIRQATASVDENLWLVDPSLLIAMESPDPTAITVNEPALSHDHATSTPVLAMTSVGGQVASCLKLKPKKEQASQSTPSVTHGKHRCYRVALSMTLELSRITIRTHLGMTAWLELFSLE